MNVESGIDEFTLSINREIYLREVMSNVIVKLLKKSLSLLSKNPKERDEAIISLSNEYAGFFDAQKVSIVPVINSIVLPYIIEDDRKLISYALADLANITSNENKKSFLIDLANKFNPKPSLGFV